MRTVPSAFLGVLEARTGEVMGVTAIAGEEEEAPMATLLVTEAMMEVIRIILCGH